MPTLLLVTIVLPLAGALVLLARPGMDRDAARKTALGVVLVTLALSLVLAVAFRPGVAGPQFAATSDPSAAVSPATAEYGVRWVDTGGGPGIRFALGLDGLGLALFVLTTVLMIPSVFASWEAVKERAAVHYALMLLLEAGLLGLFAALDVVLFYIFFEFTLIPLFFLIGLYGGPERRRASVTFFLYTLAGSLLTLLGVIALVVIHQQQTGVLTFSIPHLTEGLRSITWAPWRELALVFDPAAAALPGAALPPGNPLLSPQALIFLLLFAGFAIKVPIFPFHTWLPLAHVEAPTAGSILLAGVLLKLGAYGLIRFNLGMTPYGAQYFVPLMLGLSVVGIIYGALTALAQTDVKRLVAYSSVSHMGFVTLGLFSLTATGLDGAAIQLINHGITTGALFACVGVLYERYHTREMGDMGGLWARLPLLAFFLILSALGSAAVPFTNGFTGEFPILVGAFGRDPFYATLATIGMVLGAYYLLLMVRRVLFGPLREPGHDDHGHAHAPVGAPTEVSLDPDDPAAPQAEGNGDGHEHDSHGHHHAAPRALPLRWHEVAGLAPLMVLIVAIGVYPKPIFDRISPPLRQIDAGFYGGTAARRAAAPRLDLPTPAPAALAPATGTIPNQDRPR